MIINMMIGASSSGSISSENSLTVTGVAGDTVTIAQGSTSQNKTLDTNGTAVFKNIKTGTWTVTMTNGFAVATKDVVVGSGSYTVNLAYAVINVVYPSGSTCSMTNGTKTANAPDTTGSWVCALPALGSWTISCTNGVKTTSRTVEITEYGQVVNVTLAYDLYLFDADNGGDIMDNTGGWNTETTYRSTVSITASALELKGIGESYVFQGETYWRVGTASAITKKSIDVTGFNTIHVVASVTGANQQVIFGESVFDLTNGTTEIDISAVVGEYNIKLTAYGTNRGNTGNMSATKAWLT